MSVQRPAVPSSPYVPTAPHDPQNFVFFARLHVLLFASRSRFDSTVSCVLRHVPQAKVQLQRELETAEQRANARRQSSSAAADAEALRLAREQAETADFEVQRSQQQLRELERAHGELQGQLNHEKDVHDRIQVRELAPTPRAASD